MFENTRAAIASEIIKSTICTDSAQLYGTGTVYNIGVKEGYGKL